MLLPTKACFAPGEPVTIELPPGLAPGRLVVDHLGTPVAEAEVASG